MPHLELTPTYVSVSEGYQQTTPKVIRYDGMGVVFLISKVEIKLLKDHRLMCRRFIAWWKRQHAGLRLHILTQSVTMDSAVQELPQEQLVMCEWSWLWLSWVILKCSCACCFTIRGYTVSTACHLGSWQRPCDSQIIGTTGDERPMHNLIYTSSELWLKHEASPAVRVWVAGREYEEWSLETSFFWSRTQSFQSPTGWARGPEDPGYKRERIDRIARLPRSMEMAGLILVCFCPWRSQILCLLQLLLADSVQSFQWFFRSSEWLEKRGLLITQQPDLLPEMGSLIFHAPGVLKGKERDPYQPVH